MKLTKAILMMLMLLLISLAAGAPDEAMGRVSKVVDGDTFDVTLESHDSRTSEELIKIRLADIDTPRHAARKHVLPERRHRAIQKHGF